MSGKSGGFVYGADIAEFDTPLKTEEDVVNLITLADQVLSAIERLDIPTVAALTGLWAGGGLK